MALSEETESNGENKPAPKGREAHFYSTGITQLKIWRATQVEEIKHNSLQQSLPESDRESFNPLGMVFTDKYGDYIKPDYVSDQFNKALITAHLLIIRFHDLRSGHATIFLVLGENTTVVSKRLGHSTIWI